MKIQMKNVMVDLERHLVFRTDMNVNGFDTSIFNIGHHVCSKKYRKNAKSNLFYHKFSINFTLSWKKRSINYR